VVGHAAAPTAPVVAAAAGGGGGGGGLDPNSYFAAGGRYNMRRKSDCGAERGGGMQVPDPSHFAKMRRNRSLDRSNEDVSEAGPAHGMGGGGPPDLVAFQMMYQRRQSAAVRGKGAGGNYDHDARPSCRFQSYL